MNDAVSWHIDKSTLPLSEPRRYRAREHLKFVAAQPCLVCGRRPSDPHHLRFMQSRALGRRVSDEFAVPLCRTHHRALHRRGDEAAWWISVDVDPVAIAQRLWHQTRVYGAAALGNIGMSSGAPAVQQTQDDGIGPLVGPTDRPMTSFRQFEANRRNALKSTGPKSLEGKRMSRRNALRHGLTAETVIDRLEDSEDYRGFEAAIISDYNAETAVERELVLRLASLLWRLRRIIAIETDLFQIQAEILRDPE